MRKFILLGLLALATTSFAQKEVISDENGTAVVNTSTLCNMKGYTDIVPVRIYIKDDKIVKVKPMSNQETPKYMTMVRQQMLPKWEGMDVKKAVKAKVDGVTGATVTSKVILKNVQAGCDYYLKNKK